MGQFFSVLCQTWDVKHVIYIEYRGKWRELFKFEIENGFLLKMAH